MFSASAGGCRDKWRPPLFFPLDNTPTILHPPPVNIAEIVKEIERRHPLPPPDQRRASHGQWVQPARVVAELVAKGYGVMDAVRSVVGEMGLHPEDKATRSVRACYYEIRRKGVSA